MLRQELLEPERQRNANSIGVYGVLSYFVKLGDASGAPETNGGMKLIMRFATFKHPIMGSD